MSGYSKRKFSHVVDRTLQYRFLATMLIYFIILILFFGLTLFLPDIMQMQNEDLSMTVRSAAAERMLLKHTWVWPLALGLGCILGLHSFFSFQRVAGPLYRFRWAFDQIGNGNLDLIVKIREKDYLHQDEKSLNKMLRSLENRIKQVKEASQGAFESFKKIENEVIEESAINSDQKKNLHQHYEHLSEMQEILENFKVGNRS